MSVQEQTENLEQNQIQSGVEQLNHSESSPENSETSLADTEINLENDEPAPYQEINLELESFLEDATTTKAETQANEREESQAAKQHQQEQELLKSTAINPEEAAGYAVQFIAQVTGAVRDYTGKDIQLKPFHVQVGAALFTPAIMKYGPAVKRYIQSATSGVEEDSNIPEYLAGGGLAAMAGYLWFQARKAPPIPKDVNPEV